MNNAITEAPDESKTAWEFGCFFGLLCLGIGIIGFLIGRYTL